MADKTDLPKLGANPWVLTHRPVMLPFLAEYTNQDTGEKSGGLATPTMVQDIGDAFGRVFGGPSLPDPRDRQTQADVGTVLSTIYGGNVINPAVRMPAGALGMFAGKLAKTADHEALARAEQMAASGADRNAIWRETGWFQGPDKKWRFEIDDSGAKPAISSTLGEAWHKFDDYPALNEVVSHDALFSAYPSIGRGDVKLLPKSKTDVLADYDAGTYRFNRESPPKDVLESSLHEAQHAIQDVEQFSRPGRYQNLTDDEYLRGAHEVEARNVQKRMNMNADERKATPPWETQDIPDADQIVRTYADGGAVSSWKPRYLVLHDYGGTPKNQDGVFNPYHALVFPDGSIRYRYPEDPYSKKAPHAYRLNPESIGLSYAGQVGSTPTPEALATIKAEYDRIKQRFPEIQPLSHGEAFAQTKGTAHQASRDGRELDEASWRSYIRDGAPMPVVAEAKPVPVANRGLTSYAGLSEPKTDKLRPLPAQTSPVVADASPVVPEAKVESPKFDLSKLAALFSQDDTPAAPVPVLTPPPVNAFSSPVRIASASPYGFANGGQVRGLPQASEPVHAGPLHSTVPGRTDHLPITVAAGSFVLPADIVSSLGEGNTNAGMQKVAQMFPLPRVRRADGGRVPIAAAGGEFVIPPETVAQIGGGDLNKGHAALDQFVLRTRAQTIKRLRELPAPEKS